MATPALALTVNVGSSSVKLDLFSVRENSIEHTAQLHLTHQDAVARDVLNAFTQEYGGGVVPAVVAHRIVHGGAFVTGPTPLTAALDKQLDELASLAPLHNPVAFAWLRCARDIFSRAPHILVPDTGFFADLPEVAQSYALPQALVKRYGLRRYGFHGLAHEAMLRHWLATGSAARKVITLQLGAGCSMAAICDGRPVDTTMGFTPLEGLVMATRSGDVDAGLVTWLQRTEGLDPEHTEQMLNERSGLLGVSGVSADMARLLRDGSATTVAAVSLYVYRAKKYLGAYMAVLGGADAVVFGGGVGEHSPEIRARICEGMAWCGIEVDPAANAALAGESGRISPAGGHPEVGVVAVDEARLLAEAAYRVLTGKPMERAQPI